MDTILPVAEAVISGAVDSVENLLINVAERLPKFGQPKERFPCMDGKVGGLGGLCAPACRPPGRFFWRGSTRRIAPQALPWTLHSCCRLLHTVKDV